MIFDTQGLSFDYYQYKRGYTGAIANNMNVNGTALTTVGNANLDLKLDFAKLEYRWWFGSGNTVIGLGAGAAYYKISLNANATASINGSTASTSAEYSDDAVAPLLGIGVRHAISPDLRLFADGLWREAVARSFGRRDLQRSSGGRMVPDQKRRSCF